MAAALQYLAALQGMAVTYMYEQQTLKAQSIHSSAQSKARAKRFAEIDDAQGPPDKKCNFGGN